MESKTQKNTRPKTTPKQSLEVAPGLQALSEATTQERPVQRKRSPLTPRPANGGSNYAA